MKLPGKTTERFTIPGTADQDGDSIFVEPAPVRKRDFLKVLFGRYRPRVLVGRTFGMRKANRVLRETWTKGMLDKLYSPHPMLDALEGEQGRVPIVKRKDGGA